MNNTEIKKRLYIEKPVAYYVGFGNATKVEMYEADLKDGTKLNFNIPEIEFENFDKEVPAQLLIRWLE
jgi:hypothetical protein